MCLKRHRKPISCLWKWLDMDLTTKYILESFDLHVLSSTCQQTMSMCRKDLNYTCLRFNQCGRIYIQMSTFDVTVLEGTTLVDANTVIAKSTTIGLSGPTSILVNKTVDSSILVVGSSGGQIVSMQVVSPVPKVIADVEGSSGTATNKLHCPYRIAVDSIGNMYVADSQNYRVMRYAPNITSGVRTAGTSAMVSNSVSLSRP
ncbi:unnamed protein product [Adineta ricciae]|uniref:Uncharacterized protein n=2 Tax=Adineta ricciae TaxID=249248 RepID=A0A815L4F6_ADIRI|nr:unnamed protein product [Adineta ricciae]